MHADISRELLSKEEIRQKVYELGQTIEKDYQGKDFVAVCILKGSIIFFSDLIRTIKKSILIDFMSISSYGDSRQSSGIVQILKDLDINISGKHVLIVEDIMDSGQTLEYLMQLLKSREPASIKICTLLDKPQRRVANIQPDYCGFTIPDEFVVGYGLDFAQKYRNLDYIGVLKEEIYSI